MTFTANAATGSIDELLTVLLARPGMTARYINENYLSEMPLKTIQNRIRRLRSKEVIPPPIGRGSNQNLISKYNHIPELSGVYMVRWSNDPDWIKIGKAHDIRDRLKQFTTYSPFSLLVTCIVEGDPDLIKQELHEQFKDSRAAGGEWFEMTPDIESFMSEINEMTGWEEVTMQ